MQQLRIIMEANENGLLTAANTNVYLDDERIGLIQDIKIHADVFKSSPQVEITFPIILPDNHPLNDQVAYYTGALSVFPNVLVMVKANEDIRP